MWTNFLEPGYHFPSRGTLTNQLEELHRERKDSLNVQLAMADIAITTDWTALTRELHYCYMPLHRGGPAGEISGPAHRNPL